MPDGTGTSGGSRQPAGDSLRRLGSELTRRLHALSLRARLLIVTLLLVAAGLVIAGAVTYGSLRSFLYDRVDSQARAAQEPALDSLWDLNRGDGFGEHRGRIDLPKDTFAAVFNRDGTPFFPAAIGDARLSEDLARIGTEAAAMRSSGDYSTADLAGSSYRLIVSGVSFGPGPPRVSDDGELSLIVGVPLGDANGTLSRLVLIELLVGLAVLGAIGGAGLWLVRLGLRPLTDIERTAAAIAAGDLSQRIDEAPATTEVGRLGGALNTMLGKIEAAFAERTESERRLRQFVADASHELQTPLTSVRGYAELFRRGAADRPEDLANAMRRIEAESERMGVLVDDLLLLARLDQGRPLERAPVDLGSVAGELAGDARVVDPDRPIAVEVEAPVVIVGDELRLRQVVSNLLSNARVHTPAGTPISVRVGRDGDRAVLEVADRGPGMERGHAERVFERFFRTDVSRARTSGGSGLGLSIVAAIVQAHGGDVTVDTAPGDGARFRVTLPVDAAVQAEGVAGTGAESSG